MVIEFNHTIVHSADQATSATFLAELLGLPEPTTFGPFHVVATGNGVNVDFLETGGEIVPQHYAFLVSETEFDEIFRRIRDRDMPFWADPGHVRQGEINHHDGGRGLYFQDPNGHSMEIITRPYGSGGWNL